jgi:hypothetical protein
MLRSVPSVRTVNYSFIYWIGKGPGLKREICVTLSMAYSESVNLSLLDRTGTRRFLKRGELETMPYATMGQTTGRKREICVMCFPVRFLDK